MKNKAPFTKFDNYRLYLKLVKAGNYGDAKASALAKKMEHKFKTKAFIEELGIHQSEELSRKARSGNLRAIIKLKKIWELIKKEQRIKEIKSKL